jgi:hypothetical protein
VTASTTCPRCGGPLQPPGLWSSEWRCEQHGAVLPLHVAKVPSLRVLRGVTSKARVPAWIPHPLPISWVITGIAHVGDDRSGVRGVALLCSGPSPLGGPADMALVAEEPGVGLGARLAGLSDPDPGPLSGPAEVKVSAAGHPTALWAAAAGSTDRIAYAGEARGCWLWTVLWPESASLLLLEDLRLEDLSDDVVPDAELLFGAASPRMSALATAPTLRGESREGSTD